MAQRQSIVRMMKCHRGLDRPLFLCHTNSMKNTHLQHPEDTILTGDLSVINLFYNFNTASVKIDGAPAIVWGTDPATGTKFVGTKSVFNKKKIKINHSHDEIDINHDGKVADILHACFDFLPEHPGIIQGDFIGFGGTDTFRPNTITYKFNRMINHLKIVIAPHTMYATDDEMKDAYVIQEADMEIFEDTEDVVFVQPTVDWISANTDAPVINTDKVQFMTDAEAADAIKKINACIRDGLELTDDLLFDIFGCIYLTNLYQMVIEMKEDIMDNFILYNCPKAYIGEKQINQEGFVISGDCGMMVKLVDRPTFAHANFTLPKTW